jgi:hypothetical protein
MPEQDVDVPIELRLQTDCAICGHHDEFGTIAISLAWYREDSAPKAVARCLDVIACRARVAAKRERWPLLERGESPGSPGPMQPPETTQPDGQEADDAWI